MLLMRLLVWMPVTMVAVPTLWTWMTMHPTRAAATTATKVVITRCVPALQLLHQPCLSVVLLHSEKCRQGSNQVHAAGHSEMSVCWPEWDQPAKQWTGIVRMYEHCTHGCAPALKALVAAADLVVLAMSCVYAAIG